MTDNVLTATDPKARSDIAALELKLEEIRQILSSLLKEIKYLTTVPSKSDTDRD